MTQCWEEVAQSTGNPAYADMHWDADDNRWEAAKRIIGDRRVTLGPQASQQWLSAPEHLAMVLARYRAAAALIGNALNVLEIGCGEGIGARILAKNREMVVGIDTDGEAIAVANTMLTLGTRSDRRCMSFVCNDALNPHADEGEAFDATISLDVIEHIQADREADFMRAVTSALTTDGVCVIGTPNAAFDHLASPQSRVGHVNTYTHERLYALMAKHFRVVQSFGMNDVALHFGHPDARHYLLMCGIGPR